MPRSGQPRLPAALLAVGLLLLLVSSMADQPAAAQAEPADGFGVRPEEGEVARLYQAVLGRVPDEAGFAYWVNLRLQGAELKDIATVFADGAEYQARFGVDTDQAFVWRLYRNVLGRAPDTRGATYWRGLLDQGVARDDLVLVFSESVEFRIATGTQQPDLPPFSSVQTAVTAEELGATWRPGCPVGPNDLVRLEVAVVDFGGASSTGQLVINRQVATEVAGFFQAMYENRMPIEGLRPAAQFGGDDDAMMAANNTSAFNCRPVTGGSGWSRHAFGTAIDINPLYNPYVRGAVVLPPTGAAWVDRSGYHPAMLRDQDPLVNAAKTAGWRWGGDWKSPRDYQHIDALILGSAGADPPPAIWS